MKTLETHGGPVSQRVALELGRISVAIKSRQWKEAEVHGMTPLQGHALTVLLRQPKGTTTVTHIAEQLAVALPTASEVLRVLHLRGLVSKQRTKGDARVVQVGLTAKGRRKADVVARWPKFLETAVEALPPAEQASLLQTLRDMIHKLEAQGDLPISKHASTPRGVPMSPPFHTPIQHIAAVSE